MTVESTSAEVRSARQNSRTSGMLIPRRLDVSVGMLVASWICYALATWQGINTVGYVVDGSVTEADWALLFRLILLGMGLGGFSLLLRYLAAILDAVTRREK
ncbi:hypothetical protein [Paracoccus sp. ME4]|uniref:hypothetical protein n=1 Tax=Paracoccus sp. ME4 TaxID=3138066 RepID=UPI00398B64B1